MSEEEFTIESIGMEESYCDHSCILRGEEVISDGIPSADARSIVEILNGLYDENRHLKAKASSWKITASQVMAEKNELVIKCHMLEKENRELRQQVQNAKEIAVKNDMQYQICRKEKEDFQDMCEQLRQELNGKDCRKCSNYCRDKVLDYCLVDEREPSYFSPLEWDYKAEAEKCKYYYR